MIERNIAVPDGMRLAFVYAMQEKFGHVPGGILVGLEAALRWLSDNPIPIDPTVKIWLDICAKMPTKSHAERLMEFQRRMFIAPQPEIPEEIKDLLFPEHDNSRLIEAFRRGKAAR